MEDVFLYVFIVHAFHGARRKKKLIRSLLMFNISLKFPLNPLFLVFSFLCTSEHRLCRIHTLTLPSTGAVTSVGYNNIYSDPSNMKFC